MIATQALRLTVALATSCALTACAPAGSGAVAAGQPGPTGQTGQPGAGGPGGTGTVPVSHPAPLPTAAVDATLFPVNAPARHQTTGAVVFVATTGDDSAAGTATAPFRTIARALRAASASPGTRIVVHAGTYAEGDPADSQALVIDADGTILDAAPGERATVRPTAPGLTYGLSITASHVTVAGISFDGFAANGVAIGTDARGIGDIVLCDASITMPNGNDGIAIYQDGHAAGRFVVDGLLIERVTVEGADQGITVSTGPVRSVALRAVVVRNRVVASGNSGSDCVGFESGDNILVNGADISGADADGIDLKTTRTAVINVCVHGLAGNGIKLWHGGDIVNALLYDCAHDASVVLDGAGSYRIVNTMVAFHNRRAGGAAAYAMTVGYDHPQDAIALDIVNSVFYRNSGGLLTTSGTTASFRNCLFVGSANHAVIDYAWDGSSSQTVLDSEAPAALSRVGTASGNLAFTTDPGLTDPSAASIDGFRPGAKSPLIDAGIAPAPFPSIDLLGAARKAGGAPDLGPIEAR